MFLISKRKVRKTILALINKSNTQYNSIVCSANADQSKKRDAHMLHSGQVSMAITLLNLLGGKSNGKAKETVGQLQRSRRGTEK